MKPINLVVVESPTKARTISKFLGSDYEIKASMGHVMDLPKSKLGVDIEHNFEPQYEMLKDKKNVISELQNSSKNADKIILATDPDREGEAIASHVAQILRNEVSKEEKAPKVPKDSDTFDTSKSFDTSIVRIVFHEITQSAIDEALKNPRDIDQNLVDAQTARRVLDRLVGYKLSPILWRKVRRGLSAGRVQSVALRLIVEREREIEKFKKEKYWTVHALLVRGPATRFPPASAPSASSVRAVSTPVQQASSSLRSSAPSTHVTPRSVSSLASGQPPSVDFELIEINGEKIERREVFDLYDGKYTVSKTSITNLESAKGIVGELTGKEFIVADVIKKEVRRYPSPPFTTSTLQQEAARRLGFSAKRTMSLAQKLYEEGFITYHRTDSVTISKTALFAIRAYAQKQFGDKYIPDKPRFFKVKQKLAQEAHEAIRPTGLNNQPSTINNQLGRDYAKVYDLIWRRAVASQMADAVIESTIVLADVKANNSQYRFKANGSVLVFDGFLKVNPFSLTDTVLPDYKVNEKLETQKIEEREHETLPPSRYSDATLIATLEEKGIGRPSTYATIIETIGTRQYVEKDPPAGGGRFKPTNVGIAVNDFLVENFSTIDDIPFTAEMEDQLDSIAHGQKPWMPVIRSFYEPFEQTLQKVMEAKRVKIEVEKTNEICPNCGSELVVRIGKFGKFLACSTFPACRFTKPFIEETNLTCPKCGGPSAGSGQGKIVIRKTRKGRKFYGCSNYPKCDFAAWKLSDIKKSSPKE